MDNSIPWKPVNLLVLNLLINAIKYLYVWSRQIKIAILLMSLKIVSTFLFLDN